MTAQAVVSGVSVLTGMALSNQTIVFLSAMIAGAGTDYAVFLISRYHDYIRLGDGSGSGRQAGTGLHRQGDRRVGGHGGNHVPRDGFHQARRCSQRSVRRWRSAIGVAFLAAVTLLPAILLVAAPRGWVAPRGEPTAAFWRRVGVRVVRRPATYLAASLVVLIALASCTTLAHFNYDDRKQLSGFRRKLRGIRRAGTPFPGESDDSRVPLHPVATRLTHAARARRPGADGAAREPDPGHRDGPRRHPAHRRIAGGGQGHVSGGRRSANSWAPRPT